MKITRCIAVMALVVSCGGSEEIVADNPARGFVTRFAHDGFVIDAATWRASVTVDSYGCDGALRSLSSEPATRIGERIVQEHGPLTAWYIVRRGLAPIDDMVETADEIAAGDLTSRVPVQDPKTEVGHLGLALNEMLGQIEAAVEAKTESEDRMRRFVSDASHELRTPLTSIRGYSELYRRGAELAADPLRVGRRAPAQVDRDVVDRAAHAAHELPHRVRVDLVVHAAERAAA